MADYKKRLANQERLRSEPDHERPWQRHGLSWGM